MAVDVFCVLISGSQTKFEAHTATYITVLECVEKSMALMNLHGGVGSVVFVRERQRQYVAVNID